MNRIPCRVLPLREAEGPRQMALDHALLDSVDREPNAAVFRTYRWSEPTLSLGYFQPFALAQNDPRFARSALVRRLSGGGAIWHDRDLTYALIVPRSLTSARRPADLYRSVHRAWSDHLAGFALSVRPRGPQPPEPAPRPFLCFLDHDPEDLVLDGAKVVGSAQRRRPSAVLQHGSVLLHRSPSVPELPGLGELASVDVERLAREPLGERFFHALGLEPEASSISSEEQRQADQLEFEVYRNPAWTQRR